MGELAPNLGHGLSDPALIAMARPRKNLPFSPASFFLHTLHHLSHPHPRHDPLSQNPPKPSQHPSKLRHSHLRHISPPPPPPPSPRFWTLLLLSFLGAFLLLPHLSSTLLFLRSPSSSPASSSQGPDLHRRSSAFTLGGLLSEDSDTLQCKSRGLIHKYRPKSSHFPSNYLVQKLREYEALHRRCGPGSEAFAKNAHILTKAMERGGKINGRKEGDEEGDGSCKYIFWIANSGLGNRLISIASAFVYALLTDRVLLLDAGSDMGELLCEPFPGPNTSWILPSRFSAFFSPINASSPHRFGLHLERGSFASLSRRDPPETDRPGLPKWAPISNGSLPTPSKVFSYVHLMHDYNFFDKLFFCDDEQQTLNPIPWLFMQTNLYFLPSLHLYIPSFREELSLLFPDIDNAFHHIGRYLFFPSNPVWMRITQVYNDHMLGSSRKVGIQIRTFAYPPVVEPRLVPQILDCATENHMLPMTYAKKDYVKQSPFSNTSDHSVNLITTVLITSLMPDYYDQITSFYAKSPTETGEIVRVYQPSHEVHQNTQAHGHNTQAWAEMCLLSFSDDLITSPMSTFGYVAVGLAGIKPLMLDHIKHGTSRLTCSRAHSMDPCFHAPPYYKCDSNQGVDTSQVLSYVKHCEDVDWGLKLFPKER